MKYLLDTCVLSDLNREQYRGILLPRLAALGSGNHVLSVLTLGEIEKGVRLMPEGARRRRVEVWMRAVERDFADRLLPIDRDVALIWGRISAEMRSKGTPIPSIDALIAATAIVHNLTIVTRNIGHFADLQLAVYNPWDQESPN